MLNLLSVILLIVLTFLSIAFLCFWIFWKFYFLRNPEKQIPTDPFAIVSPADGLIVKIVPFGKTAEKATVEKGILGKINFLTKDVSSSGYFIVIRLHVYDVHYQRSPITGTIIAQQYAPGKFLNAVADAANLTATLENEKNEILIEGNINKKKTKIRVKVIQIAGFLARRIQSFVHEKQKLKKGELLGVINLGSQVVLVVPDIALQIKEGDRVSGGETIIGNIEEKNEV